MTEFEIIYGVWHPDIAKILTKFDRSNNEVSFMKMIASYQNYYKKEEAESSAERLRHSFSDYRFEAYDYVREIKK